MKYKNEEIFEKGWLGKDEIEEGHLIHCISKLNNEIFYTFFLDKEYENSSVIIGRNKNGAPSKLPKKHREEAEKTILSEIGLKPEKIRVTYY